MKKLLSEQEELYKNAEFLMKKYEKSLILKAKYQLIRFSQQKGMTPEEYYHRQVGSGRKFKYTYEQLFPPTHE